ncbi:hypothetical protein BU23DRAFT_139486 [Bimuria novae-zelandiae CBS 107.79]|uniref:Uncharacterized protein n=1 Tax=Bimuria novae-zelandiae CBS 107.79 TaxID=1447943 RepID=A0A6A5VB08_9PLEO|nr:hypothetical protein BU23DRAFT_139486 [Bimuria novae-zelandiae CBS 107.79]
MRQLKARNEELQTAAEKDTAIRKKLEFELDLASYETRRSKEALEAEKKRVAQLKGVIDIKQRMTKLLTTKKDALQVQNHDLFRKQQQYETKFRNIASQLDWAFPQIGIEETKSRERTPCAKTSPNPALLVSSTRRIQTESILQSAANALIMLSLVVLKTSNKMSNTLKHSYSSLKQCKPIWKLWRSRRWKRKRISNMSSRSYVRGSRRKRHRKIRSRQVWPRHCDIVGRPWGLP